MFGSAQQRRARRADPSPSNEAMSVAEARRELAQAARRAYAEETQADLLTGARRLEQLAQALRLGEVAAMAGGLVREMEDTIAEGRCRPDVVTRYVKGLDDLIRARPRATANDPAPPAP